MSNLNFKCAVVTGGGGGIGKALSCYLIAKGKKVIIVGRTESNLKATANEIGAAGYYVLDTGKISDIPAFIKTITTEHPDLDCLINNAGVQRPLQVFMDADFLSKADEEININIRGPMHLTLGLLPHFHNKPSALIVNLSSIPGFVPFSIINPVYNGTKAWLHFWSMNLRTQLSDARSNIKVVEIAPPSVETDLHREREDPDDNKRAKNPTVMSIEEFLEETTRKLEKGDDMITAGPGNELINKWYDTFSYKYPRN